MKATPLAISDVILLEPKVFGDDRGFFFESFTQAKFEMAIGRQVTFVQENQDWNDPTIGIQWPLVKHTMVEITQWKQVAA